MYTDFTPEKLKRVLNYINNETVPFAEVRNDIEEFDLVVMGLRRRMMKSLTGTLNENTRLKTKLGKYENRSEKAAQEGKFDDYAFDDTDIANAIIFHLQEKHLRYDTRLVMSILYEVYSKWLFKNKTRICIQRPEAQEYGPWWWRCAKPETLSLYERKDPSMTQKISEKDPGLAVFIKNCTIKYGGADKNCLKNLVLYHKNSEAYHNAEKGIHNKTWNCPLDDGLIYKWRKETDC